MVAGGLVGGHMQTEQVEIIDLIDSKFHYNFLDTSTARSNAFGAILQNKIVIGKKKYVNSEIRMEYFKTD